MNWRSPFIVYRVSPDGKLTEVFYANDLKDAKYWLTYIAETGDMLCKTPANPSYKSASGLPDYMYHKQASGKPVQDKAEWENWAGARNWDKHMPAKETTSS